MYWLNESGSKLTWTAWHWLQTECMHKHGNPAASQEVACAQQPTVCLNSWENLACRGDFSDVPGKTHVGAGGNWASVLGPPYSSCLLSVVCDWEVLVLQDAALQLQDLSLVQLLLPTPVGARCGPSHLGKEKLEQQLHGPEQLFDLLQVDWWICWHVLLFQRALL